MSLLRQIPLCCCAALLSCAPHLPKTRVSATTATQTPHRATAPTRAAATQLAATQPTDKNPLLQASTLPFHFPPFDRIKQQHFAPAFARGFAAQRAEVAAIAHNPKAPTFDNTIVAMERSGQLLDRVTKVFFYLSASNTNDALQKLEVQMAPKLAAHQDAILLDAGLFARVDAIYRKRQSLGLDAESAQLLDRYETMFVRAGARLGEKDKQTLRRINKELSALTTRFRQRVLKGTKAGAVLVDRHEELAGLSRAQISAAAAAAKARGFSGKWLITLQNTTIQALLAQIERRALRERIFKASAQRCRGGTNDTTATVARLVALRAQKAALLGAANYAAWSLAEETARRPRAVHGILAKLAPAALAMAKREARQIRRQIAKEARASHTRPLALKPWDWAYYAEKVRQLRFDLTDAQVKPYFELNRVLKDGVFYAAEKLYGIRFAERHDLPVYRPDLRVFEVREADGSPLGLLLLDYFKRDNKQGGAWMNALVGQSKLLGHRPVVGNNLNIPKPGAGQPALLTFDEVTTMFHEFGHALHGLFSAAKYPLLAGTNVPRDFVEFPSQFNEMWAREPAVLAHFARHYQTGAPMPKALLAKVLQAKNYGQGYATLEYLEAAMLDQSWHLLAPGKTPAASGVMAFEAAALRRDHVAYPPVPPRYHTTYFLHLFAGGYAAAYYAYIWSEILARDAGAWFHAHGGLTRKNGDIFRAKILSRGRTRNPSRLFRDFYGRAPDIGPLLAYRGLSLRKARKRH